ATDDLARVREEAANAAIAQCLGASYVGADEVALNHLWGAEAYGKNPLIAIPRNHVAGPGDRATDLVAAAIVQADAGRGVAQWTPAGHVRADEVTLDKGARTEVDDPEAT